MSRLPAFARVDARLEKRWTWRRTGHRRDRKARVGPPIGIALVLEVLNATASDEIVGRDGVKRPPRCACCAPDTEWPDVYRTSVVEVLSLRGGALFLGPRP